MAINEKLSNAEIRKVKPPEGYPPEDGRYMRGNDYSPVAVVAILNTFDFQIPVYLENIVKYTIETGAALSGMLQTENIGIEKIIANIIANPHIRYLILCGLESEGHLTGDSLIALMKNGVDNKRRIIGTNAPTAYLYNTPLRYIQKFRRQITLINLLNKTDPELIKRAVKSCYQESPTQFMDWVLYDPGAFDEHPICQPISWRISQPWAWVDSEEDREVLKRIKAASEKRAKSLG